MVHLLPGVQLSYVWLLKMKIEYELSPREKFYVRLKILPIYFALH